MLQTIEGTYRNGRIELTEIPQGITESQVFVTFLESKPLATVGQSMSFGIFAGPGQSTEADFKDAEYQGDTDR
jgi:hypothetical protein